MQFSPQPFDCYDQKKKKKKLLVLFRKFELLSRVLSLLYDSRCKLKLSSSSYLYVLARSWTYSPAWNEKCFYPQILRILFSCFFFSKSNMQLIMHVGIFVFRGGHTTKNAPNIADFEPREGTLHKKSSDP